MKKISYVLASLVMLAAFSSCEKDKRQDIDLDNVVLDGFYVYGEATGSATEVRSVNAMAAGLNEASNPKAYRQGMYEKYIWLEADKDFALIENSNGNKKFYGANLAEVNYGYDENDPDCKNFAENPNMKILQGQLIIGEDAPKMRVKETGMYHIVLDNNTLGDLQFPQIIIYRAKWGVVGAVNANGWTLSDYILAQEELKADGSVTYTIKDADIPAKGEFKFISCNGWKINLDEDGTVKAETSLGKGEKEGALALAGNIAVVKGGLYDLVLNYTPKAGGVADAFTYTATLTQESNLPTEMYMTGADFGGWKWGSEGVVSMIPAHSEPGVFWAIRYITAANGFKFSPINVADDWSKAFGSLETNEGCSTDSNGNCVVEEDGLYMIEIDMANSILNIHRAEIYGMGDVFGDWNMGEHPYSVEGRLLTATAAGSGSLRTYAGSAFPAVGGNWWHREFKISDGKIVYRADGEETAAVNVNAGQTITFDFNAGTGTIE